MKIETITRGLRSILKRVEDSDFTNTHEDRALAAALETIKGFSRIKAELSAVLDYNWADELHDFQVDDNDSREVHIFNHLVALDNFLNGTKRTPESYLIANTGGLIHDVRGSK